MNLKYILLIAIAFTAVTVNAQNTLKGTVTETGSGARMSNVFVHDNANRQLTITDNKGNFSIETQTGHTVIFSSPGFVSDTLYVTDFVNKKIQLKTQMISLGTVNIAGRRPAFDPHTEYPEVYTRAKVYPLSPSSWFSKEARDARRLKKYFEREEQERHVDDVFNADYVASVVPLRGKDLENFMAMYRPSYAYVSTHTGTGLTLYINDSYKKFIALPADKKKGLPDLNSLTPAQ